jgi:DNA-binding NarL/FixJ family response regulator
MFENSLHCASIGTTVAAPDWEPPAASDVECMKILIVDDHPLIREGLANVLRELDNDLAVIEAENAAEALAAIARADAISLILLDLVLPGVDGLSLLTQVREARPEVPVVVLSGNDNPQIVRQAIDCGAMGFISKRSATPVLVSALKLVLSGAVYIPPQALAAEAPAAPPNWTAEHSMVGPSPTLADLGLTGRQLDVLTHLVQGKPNKVICRDLGLAEGTVKTHITAILRALNVSSRTQALFALSKMGVQLPFAFRSRPTARVGAAAEDEGH